MEVNERTVREVLKTVIDPHLGVPLDDMGMLRGVVIDGARNVEISIALPCIGCPALEVMRGDIREAVRSLEGVGQVTVKVDWEAEWKKSDLSPVAVQKSLTHGYRI